MIHSRILRKTLHLTVAAATLIAVSGDEPASAFNVRNNHTLPNGCSIDGLNQRHRGGAQGKTTENQACEKISARVRYKDWGSGIWKTADTGYWANQVVVATGPSGEQPAWSDHNGKRNGTYWGFRLQG